MTNREKAIKEIRQVWLDAALRKEELITIEIISIFLV